jgi:hypothetical protein
MRGFLAFVVIGYLVGVVVVLAPKILAKQSTSPSGLAMSILQTLPSAGAWPSSVFHAITGR